MPNKSYLNKPTALVLKSITRPIIDPLNLPFYKAVGREALATAALLGGPWLSEQATGNSHALAFLVGYGVYRAVQELRDTLADRRNAATELADYDQELERLNHKIAGYRSQGVARLAQEYGDALRQIDPFINVEWHIQSIFDSTYLDVTGRDPDQADHRLTSGVVTDGLSAVTNYQTRLIGSAPKKNASNRPSLASACPKN